MSDIDDHIETIKNLAKLSHKMKPKKPEKVFHSLPISEDERAKREHECDEQRRFIGMPGTFKITRNVDHFITEIRKQVEDVVLEETYTRDSDNYIIGIESRIRKETKA